MDYTMPSNSTQPSNPDLDHDVVLTSQSPQIESLEAEESLAADYTIPPAMNQDLNSTRPSNPDLDSEPGPSLQSPQVDSLPVEESWGTDLLDIPNLWDSSLDLDPDVLFSIDLEGYDFSQPSDPPLPPPLNGSGPASDCVSVNGHNNTAIGNFDMDYDFNSFVSIPNPDPNSIPAPSLDHVLNPNLDVPQIQLQQPANVNVNGEMMDIDTTATAPYQGSNPQFLSQTESYNLAQNRVLDEQEHGATDGDASQDWESFRWGPSSMRQIFTERFQQQGRIVDAHQIFTDVNPQMVSAIEISRGCLGDVEVRQSGFEKGSQVSQQLQDQSLLMGFEDQSETIPNMGTAMHPHPHPQTQTQAGAGDLAGLGMRLDKESEIKSQVHKSNLEKQLQSTAHQLAQEKDYLAERLNRLTYFSECLTGLREILHHQRMQENVDNGDLEEWVFSMESLVNDLRLGIDGDERLVEEVEGRFRGIFREIVCLDEGVVFSGGNGG